ncbi:MAG: DUF6377 domain-containing protein [Maribacter stanieri]
MRFILLQLLLFTCLNAFSQSMAIDSLLNVLEYEIKNAKGHEKKKEVRLNVLKSQKLTTETPEDLYRINTLIYKEYIYYQFDSVLKYLDENIQLANELNRYNLIIESNLYMIRNLCLNGRGAEALDFLNRLDRTKMPDHLLTKYHIAHYNIYLRILENKFNETNILKYQKLKSLYFDSISNSLAGNENYNSILEHAYLQSGEYQKALEYNNLMLKNINPESKDYALIYYYRASNYKDQNKIEEAKVLYTISAIANIRNAEKNNASLSELAIILFEEGKIEQANRYINFAMSDALFFNSSYRFVNISTILPLINEAYRLESNKQKRNLKVFGIVSGTLALLLLLAGFFIVKQLIILSKARNEIKQNNLSLKELNEQLINSNSNLKESNLVKEKYIANFLKICSDNIDKLDRFRKTVNKSILNKKIAELLESTKSMKMIDKEVAEFYNNFDKTFLSIYPNFIQKLNDLLIPEEAIEIKKGELLNTELRIFALIRLGINDSTQIAELLRYSKHTIYNYRVKVRNKAKQNREELEDRIMEIGARL